MAIGKIALEPAKKTVQDVNIDIGVQVEEEDVSVILAGREDEDRPTELNAPAGGLVTEVEFKNDKDKNSEEPEIERWDRYIKSVFGGQYRIDRTFKGGSDEMPGLIGSGGFARVFCVESTSGNRFAMKVVYKANTNKVRKEYDRQYHVGNQADGVVVRLINWATAPNLERKHEESDTISFILMEMMEGTLHDTLKTSEGNRLNTVEAVRLMEDICRKVKMLHTCNIVHNDIKPKNILYKKDLFSRSSRTYRIGDFGIALDMQEDTISTRAGSNAYYLFPDDFGHPARDVYSLGIMMMELLGVNPKDYPQSVRSDVSTLWSNEDVDPEIRDICRSACKPNHRERPSLDDFIDAIRNWLSRHKDEADFFDKGSSELLKIAVKILSEDKDGSGLLRAAKYFESAAGKGSGEAYYTLAKEAKLKDLISGSPDDYLQKAADLGYVKAINAVSVRKLKGLGPDGDPDEIAVEVEKLRKITDNYLPACYNVAMLIKGHVTNASYEGEAEALLKKAASGGYEPAKAVYEP